ncbi:MAG: hypothetical protein WAN76_14260, partial [Candidatus Sulfotelmatobacter sp.]
VKVMSYLILANLMIYEGINGRLKVPPGVILDPRTKGGDTSPYTPEVLKAIAEHYDAFVAANPEALGDSMDKKKK